MSRNPLDDRTRQISRCRPLHPAQARQSGVALIIALVMLAMVLIVAGVLLRNARQQEQASTSEAATARAQFAAELAAREAIEKIVAGTIAGPATNAANATTWSADGSKPAPVAQGTLSPTGSDNYGYRYTVTYKKVGGQILLNNRARPFYVVNAEGTSGAARRRVEVALANMMSPEIFGAGLIGCEAIRMDSGVTTRSINSVTQRHPLTRPEERKYDFGENGDVKTLQFVEVVSKKKTVGNLLATSATINGRVQSYGNVQLDGSVVNGTVAAYNNISLLGKANIFGDVYAGGTITGREMIVGALKTVRYLPLGEELCDPIDVVAKIAWERSESLKAGVNQAPKVTGYKNSTQTLDIKGNDSKSTKDTVTLGEAGLTTRYAVSAMTVEENVNVSIKGNVIIVVDGDFTLGITTKKPIAFTIEEGASLRVYVGGRVELGARASFNYVDTPTYYSKPTSVVIYSSASDSSINDTTSAKVRVADPGTLFRGIIYAPNALISVKSNNRTYGAFRGRWIHMEANTFLTYDEDAANVDVSRKGYRIVYWAEQPYDAYGLAAAS